MLAVLLQGLVVLRSDYPVFEESLTSRHRTLRDLLSFVESENTSPTGPRIRCSKGKRSGDGAGIDTKDEVEVKEDELIANTLKAFPSSMGKASTSGLRLRRKQSRQLDRVSVPGHRRSSPSSHASVSRRDTLSVAAEARAYAAAAATAETDPDQVCNDGNGSFRFVSVTFFDVAPLNAY